ncbi:MAG: hypothetical protein ACPL1Z_07565 [Candidatus Bathyarchaeales archaeon]
MTENKISEILEALADGKWHTKEEMQEKTKFKNEEIEKIIKFLKDYKIITVDEKSDRIRIDEEFRKLLIQRVSP